MLAASWFRRHRRAAVSAVAVAVAAVSIVSVATVYDGAAGAQVDLNDGGVWVTKQSTLQVGHVNRAAGLVDGAAYADAEGFDVLQSSERVLVTAPGSLSVLDPVTFTLAAQVAVPAKADVFLGGATVAVHDRDSGDLWVMPADEAGQFSTAIDPTAALGAVAAVTVGRDGTVFAVAPTKDELLTVHTSAGRVGRVETAKLALADDAPVALTAVGTTPVYLDRSTGVLGTAQATLTTLDDADDAWLQQPSDAAASVAVTTTDALLSVPLDGAKPTSIAPDGTGTPIVPVQVAGCVYAVWEGSAAFVRDCAGTSADQKAIVDDADPSAHFVFRVNRDVVMLNDFETGASWVVDSTLKKVDNWSEVRPPEGETDDSGDSSELSLETAAAERSADNTPPIAMPDKFGVRAGRSTLLAVTDNDSDPDGDVLTVSVDNQPAWGTVTPVMDGAALQITVDAAQTGATSFAYTIDDGRGGTATTTVDVDIHPDSENTQPEQRRAQTIPLEVAGTVSYDALPDWADPDGDDLYLQAATLEGGDAVRFTATGRVTFTSATGAAGLVDVQLVVSDGTQTQVGVLHFDVRGAGETIPTALPDHVVFRAGETATVRPLKNDISGSATALRLSQVGDGGGLSVTADMDGGVVTFGSETVGTTYVDYIATAGGEPARGVIRVDVVAPAAEAAAPIAVRDIAMLAPGGDVQIDVLGNDVDPAGGVLVVQGVTADATAGVTASVVGNDKVRITAPGGLTGPERLTYRISNGTASATGDIIVIPIAPSTDQLPPVATNDALTVRTADVGTIDVLANDASPVGSKLTLMPLLVSTVDAALGEAFVSNGALRFRAGGDPGSGIVTYQIVDETGQTATAQVTITVLAVTDANAAPQPREIEARTIAGTPRTITIPLDGIDPDGDSVELVALEDAPTRGIIGEMGDNTFSFTAEATAVGTDVFRYRVRDRLGAESVGTVRVGIAPREAVNQPPAAVTDRVSVRPGRKVEVAVLLNDTDPDGDTYALQPDALIVPEIEGLKAETSGDVVVVTAPETPGLYAFQYTVVDARGASAVGTVQLYVDPEVPLQAPRALDDRVRTAAIQDDGTAVLDVLANDADPDGVKGDLVLALPEGTTNATVNADRTVTVQLTGERQLIEYTITDPDDEVGRAFIFVPALEDLRPVLIDGAGVIQVRSGERVVVDLADHVRIVGGGTPLLDGARTPSALHTDGSSLVGGAAALAYTSAAGFTGTDAITFGVVADGDPDSTAVLSIRVIVTAPDGPATTTDPTAGPGVEPTTAPTTEPTPEEAAQLTLSGSSLVLVPGGVTASMSLRSLTAVPATIDIDDVTYTITGETLPDSVVASVSGQTLAVNAADGADVGPGGTITVRASGGGQTSTASIGVTVSASDLPRAVATTDSGTTQAGSPVTIDVTRNDVNPYGSSKPLTVVDARITAGTAQLSRSGSNVTITPAAGSTGQVTASYRIADGSGDPSREVEGLIIVRITGQRPSAPGTPQIGAVNSGSVALSWTAPADNGGSPVSSYTVRSQSGAIVATCTAPACTVTGLTNDTDYRFTVTATNAVGESPASGQSAVARPANRPDMPYGISGSSSDSSVMLAWTASARATSYDIMISPAAPDGSVMRNSSSAGYSWGGLNNGTAYRFQIRAVAGSAASDWSSPSASFTPSKVPDGLGAPRVSRIGGDGSSNTFAVSWDAPANDGGAPITSYTLRTFGGSGARSVEVSGTSTEITSRSGDDSLTFDVAATNLRGTGLTSARSAAVRVVRTPGTPGTPTITAGDGFVTASFSDAFGNGAHGGEISYEYSASDGPWTSMPGNRVIPVANGTYAWIVVRAVANVDGITSIGDASPASNYVTPTAPLTPPSISSAPSGTNKVTWSWAAQDPKGQNVINVEYNIDGRGWALGEKSGSVDVEGLAGTTTTFQARAIRGDRVKSEIVTKTATIP